MTESINPNLIKFRVRTGEGEEKEVNLTQLLESFNADLLRIGSVVNKLETGFGNEALSEQLRIVRADLKELKKQVKGLPSE